MTRARALEAFLAALCVSIMAMDSAAVGAPADLGHFKSDGTFVPPRQQDESQKSWLLPRQNRIVNPFRATPAPGTGGLRAQQPAQAMPEAAKTAPKIPENAIANANGKGWTCNIGFRRENGACVEIKLPENATIDLTGHNWMCQPGFRREGEGCVAIVVPANASLGPMGRGWSCNPGYVRQKDQCIAFAVPEHASLAPGGRNWVCDAGFQRMDNRCVDDESARLQRDADRAVNAAKSGKVAPRPSVRIQSGDTRRGQQSKGSIVIDRF